MNQSISSHMMIVSSFMTWSTHIMGDSRLRLNPDIRTEQGLKGPIGLSLGDNWYARTTRYVVTMCREMKGGLNVYEVGGDIVAGFTANRRTHKTVRNKFCRLTSFSNDDWKKRSGRHDFTGLTTGTGRSVWRSAPTQRQLIWQTDFSTDFLYWFFTKSDFSQNQYVCPAENQGDSACIVTVTGVTVSHQAFSNSVNSTKIFDVLQGDPGRLHTSHMFVSTTHVYIVFDDPIPFFL